MVGEALYRLAHPLVQDVGVAILVVFLVLAGAILLTGASLASVLRATGTGLLDTTRIVRGERARARSSARAPLPRSRPRQLALTPPEPAPDAARRTRDARRGALARLAR